MFTLAWQDRRGEARAGTRVDSRQRRVIAVMIRPIRGSKFVGGSPRVGAMKLLERLRVEMAARHYSRRTAQAYAHWVRRFVKFSGYRHPSGLGVVEVTAFLSDLAVRGRVSASTQNQALAAILFLYRRVLGTDLPWLQDVVRAKRPVRLPVVLTRDEVQTVLAHLEGVPRLVATLLYGGGLRLIEGLRLRVQDLDLERGEVLVRAGKGDRDRRSVLPRSAVASLRRHLVAVRAQFEQDRAGARAVGVEVPNAIGRKYPGSERDWRWRWVFPASRTYEAGGRWWRHHLHPTVVQRAMTRAVREAGMPSHWAKLVVAFPRHIVCLASSAPTCCMVTSWAA